MNNSLGISPPTVPQGPKTLHSLKSTMNNSEALVATRYLVNTTVTCEQRNSTNWNFAAF